MDRAAAKGNPEPSRFLVLNLELAQYWSACRLIGNEAFRDVRSDQLKKRLSRCDRAQV
jgi:hypothetical protein